MGNILACLKTHCIGEELESENMASFGVGECLNVRKEVIKEAYSKAMKRKNSEKSYDFEKIRNSSDVLCCFSGFWNVQEWITNESFGETVADTEMFPSLKCIGLNDIATVNEAFQLRFKALLREDFKKEVEKYVKDGRRIVFTGHSSGGALAIFATIWFLERQPKANTTPPCLCLTFGSPLVGDRVFNHALKREDWSRYFIRFVMKYDIVPRISLASRSSIQPQFQQILDFFNPKSPAYARQPTVDVPGFYVSVMRSACSVASHAACKMMGSTNLLLETVSSITGLSPYRPAGTFVFCTGNGKLVVVKNTDVVLQLLFYSSRLNSPAELEVVARRSIHDHLSYNNEMSNMQSVSRLDDYLEGLPLSANTVGTTAESINMILNDLNLCERARLTLRAAAELEKQKSKNMTEINDKKKNIEDSLKSLEDYKTRGELNRQGYYDIFKISKNKEDFEANVTRLELAGIWDEIIEMLKRYELPDDFEGQTEWQDLGTKYRRIAEPLDIANYYRHNKNEDTGPYIIKGRPKRYKCTQRWLEHAKMREDPTKPPCEYLESCFWAEVEELVGANDSAGVNNLKKKAEEWIKSGVLDREVLENYTFAKLCRENPPSAP